MIVDAPASGPRPRDADGAATRSARSRASGRSGARRSRSATCSPTRAHGLRRGRAAGGDAGQRDARARRRLQEAVGLGLDAIVVNGLYPARFSGKEAEKLRAAAANGLAPDALGAVRAALAEHERARTQRSHLRRLKREASAPVHTLPFLFDAEVGLDEYATLAAKLGRDLERRGRRPRYPARSSARPRARVVTGA